jgi:hypothetical protein
MNYYIGSKTLKTIRCGINMVESGFSIWRRGWKHKAAAHQLLIIIRRLSSRKEPSVCPCWFTNMNGVKYEFYQNYFIGIELSGNCLSFRPNIKPNDLLYPKQLNFVRWGFTLDIPVTRIENGTFTNGLYLEHGYRAAFKGPLTIMDVDTKEFWQSEPLDTFILMKRKKLEINNLI